MTLWGKDSIVPNRGCPSPAYCWFFDHSLCPLPIPCLAPTPLQIKELQLVLAEAHDSLRGLQEQLSQERQLRKEEADSFNQKVVQVGLYHFFFFFFFHLLYVSSQDWRYRCQCRGVALAEHLPSMWETLGSVPSIGRNQTLLTAGSSKGNNIGGNTLCPVRLHWVVIVSSNLGWTPAHGIGCLGDNGLFSLFWFCSVLFETVYLSL